MTEELVMELAKRTLETALLVAAPMLLGGLVIGVAVSLFQAVTSIQDMTLAFVPKILTVFVITLALLPWMLSVLASFMTFIFDTIPRAVY
ncbi:MAG: flagellar biosynthesis protein FliQ [Candidatus Schekmanbacteria bacterium]|nr:flagellar biosynthesis protein FliQ [Candidatus Schekmanbacteria bacterium]